MHILVQGGLLANRQFTDFHVCKMADNGLLAYIKRWFIEEAFFNLNGFVNKQNFRF